jgi:hypothetical protein
MNAAEQIDLHLYLDKLILISWQAVAHDQYLAARGSGKGHRDAMNDTFFAFSGDFTRQPIAYSYSSQFGLKCSVRGHTWCVLSLAAPRSL